MGWRILRIVSWGSYGWKVEVGFGMWLGSGRWWIPFEYLVPFNKPVSKALTITQLGI